MGLYFMALLWAESFDIYGTGNATSTAMVLFRSNGYAQAESLLTSNLVLEGGGRTGPNCLRFEDRRARVRRVLPAPVDVLGVGLGLKVNNNTTKISKCFPSFRTLGNSELVHVATDSNNSILVVRNNVIIGQSEPNAFNLATWFWLEAKVTSNFGATDIEVRLNNVPVVSVSGIAVSAQMQNVFLGDDNDAAENSSHSVDDLIIWDGTGTRNNDFMGERRCPARFPNADTADADWTPSTGTVGFSMLNKSTPNDATYLRATNPGDISEFQKAQLALDANDIAGVVMNWRARKSDAGVSTYRMGMHSGAIVQNSPEKFPDVAFGYDSYILERDPNGDIPWTTASLDAATLRLTRET